MSGTPDDYQLLGSGPIRLVVAFPRPRLSVLSRETEVERSQRWVKALTGLPVQMAVLRLATGAAGTVQVIDVADPAAAPGFERFLSAAVAGSGQSAQEVEQAQAWRREEVERVAGARDLEPRGLPDAADPPARPADRNTSNRNPRTGKGNVSERGRAPSTDRKSRERQTNAFNTSGSEGKSPAPPRAVGAAALDAPPAKAPPIAEDGSLA